jgi:FlaG/FlaF family flagellin (archaellin)
VSSVVATVLLVAIAVLLVSAGSILFLDVVDEATQPPAPQASFSFVQNGNALTITHEAGESIPSEQLTVRVDDASRGWHEVGSGERVSAGRSAQLTVSGETTVDVVWTAANGERSSTLATQTISAPSNPTFTGQNRDVVTDDTGPDYRGFSDWRLKDAGYTPEGHVRVVSSTNQIQARNDGEDEAVADSEFTPADGVTYSFAVVYDGSSVEFTVDGQTIQTSAFGVEEDAVAIQVKNRNSKITTASVSNLHVDGASIGTPDGFSTTTSQSARSLLLENGGFDDGFTLTGEFTVATSGSIGNDEFSLRIDVA